MQKILLLNAKGGSGKTTLASNLASYFAVQGLQPTLIDMDAQGSSTRWLSKRGMEHAPIHGIAGYERNSRVTRSFAMRIPQDCQRVVVDTPAALDPQKMPELTRDAHAILVPVLPSDIDIHAAAKCITDLLLVAKIPRHEQRIGVIANRVKKNTVMYRALMRFLTTLEIPILTTFRDSQNYVKAAESGIGIFEMKPYLVREDIDQWLPLVGWLAQKNSASKDSAAKPPASAPIVNTVTSQSIATPFVLAASQSVVASLPLSATASAAAPSSSESSSSAPTEAESGRNAWGVF
ncbi:MAG TPA: ParA family protein [Steroidobacteraceae bacterium]|nr:ParA family protein [Steroidobacteraceae bacterium]